MSGRGRYREIESVGERESGSRRERAGEKARERVGDRGSGREREIERD